MSEFFKFPYIGSFLLMVIILPGLYVLDISYINIIISILLCISLIIFTLLYKSDYVFYSNCLHELENYIEEEFLLI